MFCFSTNIQVGRKYKHSHSEGFDEYMKAIGQYRQSWTYFIFWHIEEKFRLTQVLVRSKRLEKKSSASLHVIRKTFLLIFLGSREAVFLTCASEGVASSSSDERWNHKRYFLLDRSEWENSLQCANIREKFCICQTGFLTGKFFSIHAHSRIKAGSMRLAVESRWRDVIMRARLRVRSLWK